MRKVTYTVYNFVELSETAKHTAIDSIRYSNSYLNYDWSEDIKNCFIEDNQYFEIEKVYFSGFYSQGDGAMFEYNAIKEKLIEEFLETLLIPNWKKNLVRYARIFGNGTHRGHYYHEYCCEHSIDYNENNLYNIAPNVAEFLDNLFPMLEEYILERYRDICKELYSKLEKEYDYLMSDTVIEDYILSNELEFSETGKLV